MRPFLVVGLIGALEVVASAAPQGEPADRRDACDARMARLEAWLAPLVTRSAFPPSQLAEATPPVSAAGSVVDEWGPVIVVDRAGRMRLDTPGPSDAKAMRAKLQRKLERLTSSEKVPPIYVQADAGARGRTLRDALAIIPPRYAERRLLVRGAHPAMQVPAHLATSPSVQALQREIDAGGAPGGIPTGVLATARALRQGIVPCAPAVRVLGDPGVDNRARTVAEGMPAALRTCQCKVADLDVVEYALLHVFGAFDVEVRWVPLPSTAVLGRARGTVADLVRTR